MPTPIRSLSRPAVEPRSSEARTPVSWVVDPRSRVLHIRIEGSLRLSEIRAAARALRSNPGVRLGTALVLDLRDAEPLARSAAAAFDRDTRADPGDLIFGRIGVVADSDRSRSLANRFRRTIASFGTLLRVFRKPGDAVAWCGRGERPTADTDDERWRRHARARDARKTLAAAVSQCLPGESTALSDGGVHALHEGVRTYTVACRSLGEGEAAVQSLVNALVAVAERGTDLHPALVAAIRQWVAEAYRAA